MSLISHAIQIDNLKNGENCLLNFEINPKQHKFNFPECFEKQPKVKWGFAPLTYEMLRDNIRNITATWNKDTCKIFLECKPLKEALDQRFKSFSERKVTIKAHCDCVRGNEYIARINQKFYIKKILSDRGDLSEEKKEILNKNLIEILAKAKYSFSRLKFKNLKLDEIKLSKTILDFASFENCSIRKAKLRGASLVGTDFHRTNMEKVDLSPSFLLEQVTLNEQMACSPDHSVIAFGFLEIKFYKFNTKNKLFKITYLTDFFPDNTATITLLKFLPDSSQKILCIGLSNGKLCFEDLDNNKIYSFDTNFNCAIRNLQFSAKNSDGRYIFIGGDAGKRAYYIQNSQSNPIKIFEETISGECVANGRPLESTMIPFVFLSQNKQIVVEETDTTKRIPNNALCSFLIVEYGQSEGQDVVWKAIVVNETTRLYEIREIGRFKTNGARDGILFLDYSEKGHFVLAGSHHSLFLWSLNDPIREGYSTVISNEQVWMKGAYFSQDCDHIFYVNHYAKCIVQMRIEREDDILTIVNEDYKRIHLDRGSIERVIPAIEQDVVTVVTVTQREKEHTIGRVTCTKLSEFLRSKPFPRHPIQLANFIPNSSNVVIFSDSKTVQPVDIYRNATIGKSESLEDFQDLTERPSLPVLLSNLSKKKLYENSSITFCEQFPFFNHYGLREAHIPSFYDCFITHSYSSGAVCVICRLLAVYQFKEETFKRAGRVETKPTAIHIMKIDTKEPLFSLPFLEKQKVRMQFFQYESSTHLLVVNEPEPDFENPQQSVVPKSSLNIYALNSKTPSRLYYERLNNFVIQARFINQGLYYILEDCPIIFYKTLNQDALFSFKFDKNVTCFDIHESSGILVAGCADGELYLQKLQRDSQAFKLIATQDTSPILQVKFSDDGLHLLAVFENGYGMKVWNLKNLEEPRTIWKFPTHLDCKAARINNAKRTHTANCISADIRNLFNAYYGRECECP